MAYLPPTEEIRHKMEEQLWQDPEETAYQIICFRQWIVKQPHLPQDHDDIWLERFLYGCKYNMALCKKVFENYYTIRNAIPEIFTNRDPYSLDIQDSYKVTFALGLPGHTPDGCRIGIMGLLDTNPSNFNFKTLLKQILLILDALILMEPWFGHIGIFDMKDLSFLHAKQFDPVILKKFLFCLQYALPISIKELHVINAPSVIKMLQDITYPFIRLSLKQNIHIHSSNLETLYKHIPQELLPEEYGGKAGKVKDLHDAWRKKVESLREWYVAEEGKKVDESKRMGKFIDYGEMFGIEGTFKYLTIE